jgi:hypothetical protein
VTLTKWLVIIGIIFILAGVTWIWLSRLGIGHLPGDIYIERKGFSFYSPITSSIIFLAPSIFILAITECSENEPERSFLKFAAGNQDGAIDAFDFRPGAEGGVIPDNLQRIPTIFSPSSNRVE